MTDIYRKYDDKSQEWGDFGDLKARQDIGIVEDTDIAEHSIAAGQYVIWKGKLYTANSAITPTTTLSTSNLTEVTNGGFNHIRNMIKRINVSIGDVTIGSNGYTSISSFKPTTPSGYTFMFCAFWDYGHSSQSNTAHGVNASGSYMFGGANSTITGVTIAYFYVRNGFIAT